MLCGAPAVESIHPLDAGGQVGTVPNATVTAKPGNVTRPEVVT